MDGLTNLVWRDATGGVVRSFNYGLNAMGMITNVVKENGERTRYLYDGLDRLVGEEVRDASNQVIYSGAYSYDLAGNRLNLTTNGHSIDFVLGQGNRLTIDDSNALLDYNNSGCIEEYCNYNEDWFVDIGCVWNERNEMTFVEDAVSGGVFYYHYDALGRRVSEFDRLTTTYFVYDGNQVVADVDETGGVMRTYAWGPGIDNLLTMTVCTGATAVTYFAVKDHLGTVHAWTDEAGAVVESYRFDAWGNVLGVFDSSNSPLAVKHSPLGNRYLWQGREYSWQTGFYYFRARWYDPRTGRWLSNDPIGISGGLNQYVFCGNDPVNKKDPLGLADLVLSLNWNVIQIANKFGRKDMFYVNGHCDGSFMYDNREFTPRQLSPKDLANLIRNHPSKKWKPGMPIVLQACQAGSGTFGNELAKILQFMLQSDCGPSDSKEINSLKPL